MREPCPACGGTGIEGVRFDVSSPFHACIVCNGTGLKPLTKHAAAAGRAARMTAIRNAQRRPRVE